MFTLRRNLRLQLSVGGVGAVVLTAVVLTAAVEDLSQVAATLSAEVDSFTLDQQAVNGPSLLRKNLAPESAPGATAAR